jgi:hypothetical protein
LLKLNSADPIISTFCLDGDDRLFARFSDSDVELVDFELDSVYLSSQMILQGIGG